MSKKVIGENVKEWSRFQLEAALLVHDSDEVVIKFRYLWSTEGNTFYLFKESNTSEWMFKGCPFVDREKLPGVTLGSEIRGGSVWQAMISNRELLLDYMERTQHNRALNKIILGRDEEIGCYITIRVQGTDEDD